MPKSRRPLSVCNLARASCDPSMCCSPRRRELRGSGSYRCARRSFAMCCGRYNPPRDPKESELAVPKTGRSSSNLARLDGQRTERDNLFASLDCACTRHVKVKAGAGASTLAPVAFLNPTGATARTANPAAPLFPQRTEGDPTTAFEAVCLTNLRVRLCDYNKIIIGTVSSIRWRL